MGTALLCLTTLSTMGTTKTVRLRIVETSDVHGCFFPYDYVEKRPLKGTLARVSTYVQRLRGQYGKNLLLLENGDILHAAAYVILLDVKQRLFSKTEMANVTIQTFRQKLILLPVKITEMKTKIKLEYQRDNPMRYKLRRALAFM